jgi:hypothetical protein
MQPFLGELLMGGMRLRDLAGLFVDPPSESHAYWSGHFFVDKRQRPLIEFGRPYLLMLNDGRQGQVVVTDCAFVEGEAVRVEFAPVGS